MCKFMFWLVTAFALIISLPVQAADNRIALVVGNKDYPKAPLDNPINDAQDMKAALEQVGFKVIYRENASLITMNEAVREFIRNLRKDSVGVVYYSGHGAQADGSNYLIPVDADVTSEAELKARGYDVGIILDEMKEADNMLNVLILDACRNNPFKGFRGGQQGLATMSGPKGTIIAYATAPGSVASDNISNSGQNGLYTSYLKYYLVQPGLTIEEMFKKVREAVVKKNSNQVPWENSSITGNFCFAGCMSRPIAVEDKPELQHEQSLGNKTQAPAPATTPSAPPSIIDAVPPKSAKKEQGNLSEHCRNLLGKYQVGSITAEEYRKECQ
jgi:uncharacterized caspase-like protein